MKKRITLLLTILMALFITAGFAFAGTASFDESVYKKGDEGRDVKLIQLALFLDGTYSGDEFSTTFGPKTEAAVKAFQAKYNLDSDGVVGSGTMDKMVSLGIFPVLTQTGYKYNDEGSEIRFIQMALMEEGLLDIDKPTTTFASMTEAAVKAFQKVHGLDIDGVVGNDTINAMVALGYVKTTSQTALDVENLSDDSSSENASDENARYIGQVSKTSFSKGDSNDDVALIQEALACLGYLNRTTYTTTFDTDTELAVRAMQANYNLTVDGVIGSGTFNVFRNLGMLTVAQAEATSRSTSARSGEYLDWFKQVLPMAEAVYGADYRGKIKIVIEDYYTGVKINALFSYGHNHMDIEPLTKEDTEKVKKLWNYNYAWTMRPVLVYYLDHVVAGSLAGMPHAASTLDRIGDNGMAGVLDLHFLNSRTHATNKIDERHQKQVRIAAGIDQPEQ